MTIMKTSGARRHSLATFIAAAIVFGTAPIPNAAPTVTLPIEVVGESGTTSTVSVDIPPRQAREVRALWMQIHGLSYADMVSVQVNDGLWVPLSNRTVEVAEPGKSYGGIGGGFATLKVTLTLPADAVVEGANTIRFRFNGTDGFASGFRVVAFDFLADGSRKLVDPGTFTHEDPNTW